MSLFDTLDLNLLRTLDVLLTERSVTGAAHVLGRSQPAVSHALGRLRDALGDPLLVRQGRALVPTPRAEQLAAALPPLLAELERTLEQDQSFDPARSTRSFRLAAPEVLAPLVPDLLDALSDAPGVRLELMGSLGPSSAAEADVVLGVLPDEAPGIIARPLGRFSQGVLCRRGHPALVDGTVGLDDWLASPHVLVRTGDAAPSLVDVVLAQMGRQRSIGFYAPNLLLIPHVLARTDLMFTGPRQILALLTGKFGLEVVDHPLELPTVVVAAMWQQRLTNDPGHRWFRERVVEVVLPAVRG